MPACLLGAAGVRSEADGPDFYDVRGVERDDVLNLREAADHRSTKIGEIPSDGTCLQNLGCSGGLTFEEFTTLSDEEKQDRARQRPRWCRIRYRDRTGWVAGHYLRESRVRCPSTPDRRTPPATQ